MTRARRSRFYVSGGLELESEPDWIVLTGTVLCAGGIRIQAAERLRIVRESPWFRRKGNPLLELQFYANNAVLSSSGPIFRYNSPHVDHNQFHHVHRYDVFGDVLGPGEQMMPPRAATRMRSANTAAGDRRSRRVVLRELESSAARLNKPAEGIEVRVKLHREFGCGRTGVRMQRPHPFFVNPFRREDLAGNRLGRLPSAAARKPSVWRALPEDQAEGAEDEGEEPAQDLREKAQENGFQQKLKQEHGRVAVRVAHRSWEALRRRRPGGFIPVPRIAGAFR
jgi:hypothetical protein